MQNTYSNGNEVERPHSTKTPTVAPNVDSKMHVVTWKRSVKEPMATQPNTLATFTKMTVPAAVSGDV